MTWNQGPYEIFQNHNCIAKTTGCPLRFCNLIMMNGLGCSIPTQVKMIVIMQGHQLYFILLWMMSAAACLNWIPLSIIFGSWTHMSNVNFDFSSKIQNKSKYMTPKNIKLFLQTHPTQAIWKLLRLRAWAKLCDTFEPTQWHLGGQQEATPKMIWDVTSLWYTSEKSVNVLYISTFFYLTYAIMKLNVWT